MAYDNEPFGSFALPSSTLYHHAHFLVFGGEEKGACERLHLGTSLVHLPFIVVLPHSSSYSTFVVYWYSKFIFNLRSLILAFSALEAWIDLFINCKHTHSASARRCVNISQR